jgi:hypothetical protein
MTEYLSRDAILKADDATYEDVPVPEWGGTVRVRGMSGAQRDAFEASIVRVKGGSREFNSDDFRAKFVSRVCVDEKGARLFTTADVKALSGKSAVALQRVFDAGTKLSGLSAGDVASLEGNSDGQSDASTSA